MAIPKEEQRLNKTICDIQPANSEEWLNEYYCIPGYRPNEIKDACIEIEVLDTGSGTDPTIHATGIGDKRYFFDSGVIDREYHKAKYTNTFLSSTKWEWRTAPQVADRLRAVSGLFWTWNTERKRIVYFKKPPYSSGASLDVLGATAAGVRIENSELDSAFNVSLDDDAQSNIGQTNRTARLIMEPSSATFWPAGTTAKREEFERLINETIDTTSSFYDHIFTLTAPTNRQTELSIGAGLMYYDVKSIYNYYVPQYEHVLESEIKETELPNLYTVSTVANPSLDFAHIEKDYKSSAYLVKTSGDVTDLIDSTSPEDKAWKNTLLKFNMDYNTWDEKQDPYTNNSKPLRYKTNTGIMQNYEYFEGAAKQYAGVTGTMPWANKFNNVLVAHGTTGATGGDNIKDLQAYNIKKDTFPMYMYIEFSTPDYFPTSFTEKFKDSELSCHMMKHIVKGSTAALSSKQYIEFLEPVDTTEDAYTDDTGTVPKERRMLNIDTWFTTAADELDDPMSDVGDNFIFLGSRCKDSDKFSLAGNLSTLASALSSISPSKDRTFRGMLNGETAKTEIVLYRIEKTDINGNVIQNFFLPSSKSFNAHKFIDTQVKYGKQYTYTIYAWVLVYGMKYAYGTPEIINSGDTATIAVTYQQDTKLIEVPYFEYTNKILDTPPAKPAINITPYYGVNNKLMFSLESGFEEYEKKPETVEDGEASDIASFLTSQNRTTQKLKYSTDDFISKYRIYRLDFHPERYTDFAEGVIKDVSDLAGNSISIDETILPNKKYWYIFRSIDKHNHISYPSDVYQVELVDDGASIYPLIDTVEFTTPDTKAASKKLKKIMHIMPSLGHRLLPNAVESALRDEGTSGDLAAVDYKLGITNIKQESLWGKKFKIRLTSKKTGRKIDLNVEFKNEHISN